ncbi:hypothetical protein QUB70_24895 [Microcoleus sp. A003_D6]|uniref:hypothetical protein n=1 Tax=Microcoleus sp. A003_D6 TaxID=3055266 RepID=UPI002FD1A4C6
MQHSLLLEIQMGCGLWVWFRTGEKAELANKKIIGVALGASAVKILNEYKAIIDAEESLENSQ